MLPDKDSISVMIEEWRRPRGIHALAVVIILVLMALLITGIVYMYGGTVSIYPHLMYPPIILASVLFRMPGGIVAGLIAGLLLGPYMPLSTVQEIPQQSFNWIMRMGFFMGMGAVGGFISRCYNDHLDNTQEKSLHDPLTGLQNLQSLYLRLEHLFDEEEFTKKEIILAILSISNLQQIVSTLSYRSSSVIIRQIADRLEQEGDLPADSLFRIQDNNFAVVAVDVNIEDFIAKCRMITKHLEEPFLFEGVPITVNMHLGIASSKADGENIEELIQKAGIAAYKAEKNKTVYAVYSVEDDSDSVERLTLLGSMKKAIDTSELTLYLQPKVSMADGVVVGVESLIRWQHPEKGLLSPYMFVPEAENTWLSHPLSLFAIKEGLAQMKCLGKSGFDIKLAVNLTAHNIQDRIFIARFIKSVRESGIDVSRLEIEITERFLLTELDAARDALGILKKMGASIAIDDFGSGYSSVSYIQEFPIDTVKIDQSIIANVATSSLSRSLIRHMLEFNKELGITTVAEGVETEEQFNLLAEMGCDIAQGYYVGHPLPCREFGNWLASSPWKVVQQQLPGGPIPL